MKNVLSIISIIGLKLKLVTNNFMSPKQNFASIFTHYNPMILTGHLMIINSFSLSVCSSVRITLVNLGIWGEGSILLCCCDVKLPWYMLPWRRDVKAWEKVSSMAARVINIPDITTDNVLTSCHHLLIFNERAVKSDSSIIFELSDPEIAAGPIFV